jgi:uncharacterized protein involved in exopolysaccharide biosynthesis
MEAPEFVRTSLRDFLHVIFKRKSQIMFFFLITFCAVMVGTFIVKPTYRATAQILVKIGRESVYVPATGGVRPVINFKSEERINSEIEILKSPSLAEKVVLVMGPTVLYEDLKDTEAGMIGRLKTLIKVRIAGIKDRFFPDTEKKLTPDQRKALTLKKATLTLRKNMDIENVKKSDIVQISFKHTDPQMTAAAVNTLARLYLDRHLEVHKTPQSYDFFQQQSKILKHKLDRTEEKLQRLKEQYDVTALDEQQSLLLKQTAELHTSFNETRSLQVEKEKRIQQLDQQLVMIPKTISQGKEVDHNPIVINTLEGRLMELQLREKDLLTKYTDQNRLVRNVRDEIEVVQQKLSRHETKRYGKTLSGANPVYQHLQEELLRSRADLKSLNAKSKAQNQQLADLQKKLDALNKIEVLHDQLEQEVEVVRQNYRLYLTKFEESRISNAMDHEKMASVNLIEPAQTPLKPISPKVLLNLALGLFLGAFGGLGLAFFLEYLDDSLETIEDVEEKLQLPVLASSWS